MTSIRDSGAFSKWALSAVVAVGVGLLVAACGTANTTDGASNTNFQGGACQGCACSPDGATANCGYVKQQYGGYVTCAEGTTTCENGTWGACSANHTTIQSTQSLGIGGGLTVESLGMNSDAGDAGDAGQTNCAANPCDPACQTFVDNSNGVDAGNGLVPVDGGWTLGLVDGAQITVEASTACTVTLKGIVYDPASLEPVFNAVVAVPNAGTPAGSGQPPAIPTGVPVSSACTSGFTAIASTLSLKDGTFSLGGVPVQSTVTLVVQIGNWRRLVTLNTSSCSCGGTIDITNANNDTQPICVTPNPSSCAGANNYSGTASCLTRLPRKQSEGNIPHIALTSGACDPMECLVYRMGVDRSEFTDENGTGRVHYFYGHGAGLAGGANHTLPVLEGFSSGMQDGGFETSGGNGASPWAPSSFSGWYPGLGHGGAFGGTDQVKWAHGGKSVGIVGPGYWGYGDNWQDILGQTFTAPPGATTLTYYWYGACTGQGSYFQDFLVDLTSQSTSTNGQKCTNTGWNKATLALTAGHAYTVNFINQDNWQGSWTAIDDVSLNVANNTPSGLLDNYDLVMLPCDCGLEYNVAWGTNADDPGRTNLVSFANGGGRMFSSHWGREWIERGGTTKALANGPFPGVASWYQSSWGGQIGTYSNNNNSYGAGTCNQGVTCSTTGYFDNNSTRATNFANWMGVTAGSSSQMTIAPARYDVQSITSSSVGFVNGRSDGQGDSNPDEEFDFTFDTPLGASALGRVMYTDMHLATGSLNPSGGAGPEGWGINVNGNDYTFPDECPAQGSSLSQQELAAEYLLFDLGACVSGTGSTTLPPLQTTADGTNDACSGGTSKDIIPSSCTTNADCEMDYHCQAGQCVWSGGNGYVDPTCTDANGNPAVDLTIGVPCATAQGVGLIPICNRGTAKLGAGAVITLEDEGNGSMTPWNCTPPPTPNPPKSTKPDACTYTLPVDLTPGMCLDVDLSQDTACAALLQQGERYLFINYDQSIPECGTGFAGSGPGCMNNTTHTKATGGTCPPTCGTLPPKFSPATFTRDFDGACPAGYRTVWHLFSWSALTPSDSDIVFTAFTADTQAQLGSQFTPAASLGTASGAAPDGGASISGQTDVDTDLAAAPASVPKWGTPAYASHTWLRVNMALNPSTDQLSAPTLLTWNQQYDCIADQ